MILSLLQTVAARKPHPIENHHLDEPQAKKRKVDDEQNNKAAASANDDDQEETPPIYNLIDDCCYVIFGFLSHRDLTSFGKTCKWAQQNVIYFYKMNHLLIDYKVLSRPISGADVFDLENAQKLSIWGKDSTAYHQVKTHCNQLVKKIHLDVTTLSIANVNCIKKILSNVEHVTLEGCDIHGEFHDRFLKFCKNLKVLSVESSRYHRNPNGDHVLIGANNGWLTRKYPKLEHLRIIHQEMLKVDELQTFFKDNSNVRHCEFFISLKELVRIALLLCN